jgi:hypothetical protein
MGEYIAAGAILSFGTHKVSLCQQDGIDMVAFNDDCFLRIQVKTASLHKRKHHRPAYQFQLARGSAKKHKPTEKDFDIIALVAGHPEHRRCLFLPVRKVLQYTKRLPVSAFSVEAEIESWHRAVNAIIEARRMNGP